MSTPADLQTKQAHKVLTWHVQKGVAVDDAHQWQSRSTQLDLYLQSGVLMISVNDINRGRTCKAS